MMGPMVDTARLGRGAAGAGQSPRAPRSFADLLYPEFSYILKNSEPNGREKPHCRSPGLQVNARASLAGWLGDAHPPPTGAPSLPSTLDHPGCWSCPDIVSPCW